ncbi:MAG: hypothetical protein HY293_17335 [Planctomycetes bacterium]|nr:hypothetical protein [Planctomycetota bacterium]
MNRVLLAAALVVACIPSDPGIDSAPPEHDEWQRFSQRCAGDSLRTLAEAEVDFRACDRDWNRVNDFWTAGVGLYRADGDSIKLIELSVASADEEAEEEETP